MRSDKPDWTQEQEQVINARGSELLVSAAAGSGKTAVLVERIYNRIMDKDEPVDIDRFVVVTFTKAAAAEMKERLRKRMEDALSDENLAKPARERLIRQLRLIPGAHISTVHSFCNYIIGQYFYRIGLDPAFSEADESELVLIKNQVLDSLLESEYEKDDESFERVASLRALNKNDSQLKKWILEMYEHAYSEPFPDLTMDEWEKELRTPLTDEKSKVIPELIRYVTRLASGMIEPVKKLLDLYAGDLDGEKDLNTLNQIISTAHSLETIGESFEKGERDSRKAYEDMRIVLMDMELKGLPKNPVKKEDAEIKNMVIGKIKPIRERLEESFRDVFFSNTIEEHEKERKVMAETTCAVIRLTGEFAKEYAKEKRDRGVVDFNDLEQFALKILFDTDENGKKVKSDAAKELSEYFSEVMIDEYQDSNRVQDTILWSISKSDGSEQTGKRPWECTGKNRFMVGDIKQSIYRFRHACPDLFRHKLNTYAQDENAKCRRIDLHKNFRSAEIIIDSTNEVFDRIMRSDIGGVEYDEDARLVYGLGDRPQPEKDIPIPKASRIDLIDEWRSRDETEAYHIACQIKAMVEGDDPLYIIGENNEYRRVNYGDIVILSRAVMPIAYEYTKTFRWIKVPFVTELTNGFFDTREISLIIQLLSIIDNPRQDIALAGVLASNLFGIDDRMLSEVRIAYPYGELFDAVTMYANMEKQDIEYDDTVVKRLGDFLQMLDEFRAESPYIPMTALVEEVYQKTGIYEFFSEYLDDDYKRRRANLDYFLYMVTEFDRSSKQGIHAFVDHLRLIRQNEVDIGEAQIDEENENVVRLMSIHKSKGLEFPVVFITRAGSKGVDTDAGRFVYDTDIGVGGLYDDEKYGWTKRTLGWNLIHERNKEDERGELFRLLYVAMTRAKEQLIIVSADDFGKPDDGTGYEERMKMKALTDMLKPALIADETHGAFEIRRIGENVFEHWNKRIEAIESPQMISDTNIFDTYDEYNSEKWDDTLTSSELPPVRLSVSELKKASMEESETGLGIEPVRSEAEDLPRFMRKAEKKGYTGAERGTIYHQAMATMDFSSFDPENAEASVDAELQRLVETKHLKKEDAKIIDPKKIRSFFESDLGKRMIKAAASGKLKRENPFILNKTASSIGGKYSEFGDAPIMIQGIIDGYFEEGDQLVLMDYKTDRTTSESGTELAEKYHVQMELYKEALEKLLGKKVKECYLYSFHLDREIKVEF